MKSNKSHREQPHRGLTVESLENRALMSATVGGLTAGASDSPRQPPQTTSATLLPAVQKAVATTPSSSGIIAILIGL
jgi:hypothetical protein